MFVSASSLRNLVPTCHSVRQAILKTQFLVQSGHLLEDHTEVPEEEIGRKSKKKFVLAPVKVGEISEAPDEFPLDFFSNFLLYYISIKEKSNF